MNQLDKIQSRLNTELGEMNRIISSTLSTSTKMMNDIVQSYLEKKGKQIRPIMVIVSAKMFGEVNNAVLNAGAALEMLHNASLIHDDVVDETNLRRGLPTINAAMGNRIAVLVGDFFVSNALEASIKTGNIDIIASLSALGKELSIGEIDQICNVREHHFDQQSYFMMIRKKTASLFMNCVKMGAEAVGANAKEYAPLVKYAELLGLCFQIKDDIFDYDINPQIGKPTGNDLREGKVTLPLIYALENSEAEISHSMKEILLKGDLDQDEIQQLIDFAKANGGVEYAFEVMRQMQKEAETIISVYPDSEAKETFGIIFDYIISRNK